ncbi:MAG TPA: T9SS type A sorting domain-containing protein, partial [Flavisolibacter sp.]|nr:T9SS type A sorting domain-containing protein [Flavisolibacter sp.]
ISFAAFFSHAQIQLTKAYTPQNGNSYFELANNGASPLNLGCYTLISYYKTTTDRGFYVLTLPNQNIAVNAVVTIGTAVPSYGNNYNSHINFSLKDLFAKGLLQKHVISINSNSFINNTALLNASDFFDQPIGTNESDDRMILLFNGSQLADASFPFDVNNNLSQFLSLLPNLSFTNSCGNLVTVRFGTLPSMYAAIFNQPYETNENGYFKEFQIRRSNATVQIAWQTSRERNSRGFEIERKTGNESWTTIAYVASLAPAGNSNEALKYLYGDNGLPAGNVQYRLKQMDMNGRTTYSSVQTPDNSGLVDKVVVYPNPNPDGRVNVAFGRVNSLRDVQVLDINGQLIQQWLSVNNISQQINDLQRGNYIVRVIDRQTGIVSSEKIIVQ